MEIQGVNNTYPQGSVKNSTQTTPSANPATAPVVDNTAAVFEKSEVNTLKTYEKPKAKDIAALIAKSEQEVAKFKEVLGKYFVDQSKNYDISTRNVKAQVMQKIAEGATQEDIDAAKAQIAEGGFYSVAKTTDRIMEMAKALANGDPSKISVLKDAVEKGFKQATQAWGSELPQISQDTYKAVMAEFDKWAGTGETEETQATA